MTDPRRSHEGAVGIAVTAWNESAVLTKPRVVDCIIRAYLAAMAEAGFKLVPREATEEMLRAGGDARIYPSVYMGGPSISAQRDAERIYHAMHDAAPPMPPED